MNVFIENLSHQKSYEFQNETFWIDCGLKNATVQVSLQRKDRNVTRFSWLKRINQAALPTNIEIYHFEIVSLGIIPSR